MRENKVCLLVPRFSHHNKAMNSENLYKIPVKKHTKQPLSQGKQISTCFQYQVHDPTQWMTFGGWYGRRTPHRSSCLRTSRKAAKWVFTHSSYEILIHLSIDLIKYIILSELLCVLKLMVIRYQRYIFSYKTIFIWTLTNRRYIT